MNEPYLACPRFQRCSVNQCPLDPEMLKRPPHPHDREQKCHAQRATREVIAAQYPELPTHGLTLDEVVRDERRKKAKERWEAMSLEERARRMTPWSELTPEDRDKRLEGLAQGRAQRLKNLAGDRGEADSTEVPFSTDPASQPPAAVSGRQMASSGTPGSSDGRENDPLGAKSGRSCVGGESP